MRPNQEVVQCRAYNHNLYTGMFFLELFICFFGEFDIDYEIPTYTTWLYTWPNLDNEIPVYTI
jgi:hypothetical protein